MLRQLGGVLLLLVVWCGVLGVDGASWLTFNGDATRSGVNEEETIITQSNVRNLKQLWDVSLPDTVDSAPVFQENVLFPNGATADVLAMNGHLGPVMVLFAENGTLVWHDDSVPYDPNGGCFGRGTVTKSTPQIYEGNLYVFRMDGYVHVYSLTTGVEQFLPGFPTQVTLTPSIEQGSSSINIVGGYLYMTTSGYVGDCQHYVGHVVSVDLASGTTQIWNSLCSDKRFLLTNQKGASNYCSEKESGIWARAGVVYDPLRGGVYAVSGNGNFNANTGGNDYGDTIALLTLGLNSSEPLIDTYTPYNYRELDTKDHDLGSTAPVLLPKQEGSNTPYMIIQGGKDAKVALLNRYDMSSGGCCGKVGGEVDVKPLPQGGYVFTAPLAYQYEEGTFVYIVNKNGFVVYSVQTDSNSGNSTLQQEFLSTNIKGNASPILANNVLFIQTTNKNIVAVHPTTFHVLWTSSFSGSVHWQSPIVVNGKVYAVDSAKHAYCFGFE